MDDPVEQIENYCPGGFHPVEIGDELYNGRYRILHRLGHGAFSTVWLAQNQLYENKINGPSGVVLALCSRYVAIKILCAEVSHAKSDSRIMRQIPSVKETIPGSEFVAALLDEFEIEGPNGLHRCMVMEVFGPSIFAVKECSEIDANPLPLEIARRIIVQCAKGLSFLHSHGIVHGDFRTMNIAFALPDINAWTVDEIYNAFGEPVKVPLSEPTCHQPRYQVALPSVANLWALVSTLTPSQPDLPSIRIFDFTESFYSPLPPDHPLPGTPMNVAAPEILLSFKSEVSMSIDIWAFACLTYELLGTDDLFIAPFGTTRELLAYMIFALGGKANVPERFWDAFWLRKGGKTFFDKDGESVNNSMAGAMNWDEMIKELRDEGLEALPEEDEAVLRRVLNVALRFEPTERATAEEIVGMFPRHWETSFMMGG